MRVINAAGMHLDASYLVESEVHSVELRAAEVRSGEVRTGEDRAVEIQTPSVASGIPAEDNGDGSRRDIRREDFDGGEPLLFKLHTVFATPTDYSGGPDMNFTLSSDGEVTISPSLIRRGIIFDADLITDGKPRLEYSSQLADEEIREGRPSVSLARGTWAVIAVAAATNVLLVSLAASSAAAATKTVAAVAIGAPLATAGAAIVLTVWFSRGPRRD